MGNRKRHTVPLASAPQAMVDRAIRQYRDESAARRLRIQQLEAERDVDQSDIRRLSALVAKLGGDPDEGAQA